MSGMSAGGGFSFDLDYLSVVDLTISGHMYTDWQNEPSYDDDAAAAAGGVILGEVYRNGNFLMVRIS